jgi:hypothetical protein
MTLLILQTFCGDVSDVTAEAVKNVRFRCSLSFYDVGDVVAALYNPFQTCYEYGGGICTTSIIIFK